MSVFCWKTNLHTVESTCYKESSRPVSLIGALVQIGRSANQKEDEILLIPKVIIIKNSFQAVLFIQMLQTKSNHILQIWKFFEFFSNLRSGALFSYLTVLFYATEQIHRVSEYCPRIQGPLLLTEMGFTFLKMGVS